MIPTIGFLSILPLLFLVSCQNASGPLVEEHKSSSTGSSSSVTSSVNPPPTSDTLWTCTLADSTYELSANDTSLSALSISIGGTVAPNPTQFQAFMRFTRYGKAYKICLLGTQGSHLRVVRGEQILEAGARKISAHGLLDITVQQDTTVLFERPFSESMEEYLYRP